MNKLRITIISLNSLVFASFWLGRSKYVFPLDSWLGLIADNVALLVGMASSLALAWLILKS